MNNNMQDIEINKEFKKALDTIRMTSNHLFITGKAGTGKSTLLKHFQESSMKNAVFLAPTGIAALNINGQTIHKFFNFYIDVTPWKIKQGKYLPRGKKNRELLQNLDTIVIDEVSMLRADLLDCIDAYLQMYGPVKDAPFGGVQMIFIGDMYQLPPVVSSKDEKEIFQTLYESPYFFSAKVMKKINYNSVELKKVYRQKDFKFIDVLNRVRNNDAMQSDIDFLNSNVDKDFIPDGDDFFITLTTTNKKADFINSMHLGNLESSLSVSEATIDGEFTKEYYPTIESLYYKVGAQVMLLNNDSEERWVNGTIGVIKNIVYNGIEECLQIYISETGRTITVPKHTWEVYKFTLAEERIQSEKVGSFTQFPIRLAWSVTIHKSQGKTFDKLVVDLDRGTFASGQLYVALSRATSMEGLVLTRPIWRNDIKLDRRIQMHFEERNG